MIAILSVIAFPFLYAAYAGLLACGIVSKRMVSREGSGRYML